MDIKALERLIERVEKNGRYVAINTSDPIPDGRLEIAKEAFRLGLLFSPCSSCAGTGYFMFTGEECPKCDGIGGRK